MEFEGTPCTGFCDEDAVSSSSQSGADSGACCCCHYDPFEDDSPEMRIKELPFALTKISVMKCQMRKWREERLELESNNRSLKQALQQYGVDPDEVLRPDPLLVHLRGENLRLQNSCDALQDEVRDLRDMLADYERYESPCDAAAHVKAKILELRHRYAVEKNKLRETIANLRMKLAEAQEDSSCAALNRLRAKLRELMRDERKGDQQVSQVVGKSIETMVEFSKSCDELRRENERLLAEIEMLKREIQAEKGAKENDFEKENEISDLSKRVNACEDLVAQLRLQLAEKDAIINDLQKKLYAERRNSSQLEKDLDSMAVSQKALTTEINAMKDELKEKDSKVTKLLRDLRNSTTAALGMSELEGQIEQLKPELYKLETHRDELMGELSRLRQELSARNDQIIKILEERDKLKAKMAAELEELRARIRELEDHEGEFDEERKRLVERIKELENELKRLSEIDDLNEKLRAENEALKADSARKDAELKLAEQERESLAEDNRKLTDNLKKCSAELEELAARIRDLEQIRDELESQMRILEGRLEEELKRVDNLCKEMDMMREEEAALRASLTKCEEEGMMLAQERDNLLDALRKLEAEEAKLRDLVATLKANEDELNKRIRELQESAEATRRECEASMNELNELNAKLAAELDKSKAEVEKLTKEKEFLKNKIDQLQSELEQSRSETLAAIKELELNKKLLADMQNTLASMTAEKEKLELELGDLKWQLDKIKKDLDAETAAKSELLKQLQDSQNSLEKCLSTQAKLEAEVNKLKGEMDKIKDEAEEMRKAKEAAEKAKAEMEQSKKNVQSELTSIKRASIVMSKEVEKVKQENEKAKIEMIKSRRQSAALVGELNRVQSKTVSTDEIARLTKELQQCRAEVERLRNKLKEDSNREDSRREDSRREDSRREDSRREDSRREDSRREDSRREDSRRDDSKREGSKEKPPPDRGDFAQASEMLMDQIEKQIKATDRLKDFISYAEGKIKKKPEIMSDLFASGGNWSEPQINQLFEKAKTLSDALIAVQQEAQNLEQTGQGDNIFDPTSWLQSLTMCELAELHDKICAMTEHMLAKDMDEAEDLEEARRELLNSRIAALQRKIAEKQYQAAVRADEMRRALMLEQAQLVSLTNETNLQRERNLALFMSVKSHAEDSQRCPEESTRSPNNEPPCCCNREDCMLIGCRDTSHQDGRRK